jgi:hypothetical protein
MMIMPKPLRPPTSDDRGRHADLKLRVVINPLLSQSTAVAPASSTNPRESQPESGKRFTSQTGQHHHETLGQFSPDPAHPYKSAVQPKVATVWRTPVPPTLQDHRRPDGLAAAVDQEQQRGKDQSLDGVDYVSDSNNDFGGACGPLLEPGSVRLVQQRRTALRHHHPRPETTPLPRSGVERRFGCELIERIVAEYASGMSTTHLARSYGIGKGTLLRLLGERTVLVPRHGRALPER